MRYTTFSSYPMTAEYIPWEEQPNPATSLVYRKWLEEEIVPCTVSVTPMGAIKLSSPLELQAFAIIRNMRDAAGNAFMADQWYAVKRATPVMDAFGYLVGYRHDIAAVEGDYPGEPIEPGVDYPLLDQSPW